MTTTASNAGEDVSVALSEHVAAVTFGALPDEAVEASKRLVLNTLAIALAGHAAEGAREAVRYAIAAGPLPQAPILGAGRLVAAPFAAYVNATLANAHDFDDNFDLSPVHAGPTLVATILAVAALRPPIDGRDTIAALAAGVDVVCSLALARSDLARHQWHSTSVLGYFGCAAAAAKLLGLDADGIHRALGLAYSMTSGTKQCIYDGAPKANQMGNAAQSGLLAALMAESGVVAARRPLEGDAGFATVYLQGDFDRQSVLSGLGDRHFVSELSLKPYPSCRFTHAYIDAALALGRERSDSSALLERIVATTSPADRHIWEPSELKRSPRAIIDAQFSGYYAVANALLHGPPTLAHFTPEALSDPATLELCARVEHEERDDGGCVGMPPVTLTAFSDGRTQRATVAVPKGSPSNPLTFDEVAAKFRACSAHAAVGVAERDGESVIAAVGALEGCADVASLSRSLVGTLDS